jgi:hypothetical protein
LQQQIETGIDMTQSTIADEYKSRIYTRIAAMDDLESIRQDVILGTQNGLFSGEEGLSIIEDAENRIGFDFYANAIKVFEEEQTGVPGAGLLGSKGNVTLTTAQRGEAEYRLQQFVNGLINDNSNNIGSIRDIDAETINAAALNIRADIAGETTARRVQEIELFSSMNNDDQTWIGRDKNLPTETLIDFVDADGMVGRADQFAEELDQIRVEFRDYVVDSISNPSASDRYNLAGLFGEGPIDIPETDVWVDEVSGRVQLFVPSEYESEARVELPQPDGRRGYVLSVTILNGDVAPVVYDPRRGDGAQLEDYMPLSEARPKLYLGRQSLIRPNPISGGL